MNTGSNKMDSNLTGMWVSFFTAAGIPSDVAATYALTFTENRIQTDMFLDLNKEYLRDMGITRMGDIIAILRHAKQVHESTARDRVLSTTTNAANKVPVAAITGRSTLSQPSSPASRILEHYTRNPQAPEPPAPAQKLKRKSIEFTDDGSDDLNTKKARLIRFGSQGNTHQQEGPSNKQTVFSRLGTSDAANATSKAAVKPIYARLGSKQHQHEKQQHQPVPIEKDALKYEGILKSSPVIKKVVTVTTTKNNVRRIAMGACTMRADETPVSVKEKLDLPKAKSVKFSNHVQYKEIEGNKKQVVKGKAVTTVFNKPERRLSMPESNDVKTRLGTKSVKNISVNRNVFHRLGA
ncbi:hypothetical protein O3G_MSEX008944 [Manduca sexta]|uniref:SAM domain-containing protein n=1 Tax=Manduca sexta TaxID=7130 RepID=A0A921ZDR2_MANSE|nr:hypothetical protein O3G_MSEX008944 [Manduca sexta]